MRRAPFLVFLLSFWAATALTKPLWADTFAYIPSSGNDKVIRVATDSGEFTSATIAADSTCGPYGAAVAPNGRFVLVSCATSGNIVALYDVDFTATSDAVPSGQIYTSDSAVSLRGVAIEPQSKYVYFANFKEDLVTGSVLRASASNPGDQTSFLEANVGNAPMGIAAVRASDDTVVKVYVANYSDGSVTVLTDNGTTLTTNTINSVGLNPVGVAASPDGLYIYVANYTNNAGGTVAMISTLTDTVVRLANVGLGPWGVAVGSRGSYLYVTNSGDNTVSVLSAQTLTLVNTYTVGTQPFGIAAPKNGDFAYAINNSGIPISNIEKTQIGFSVNNINNDSDHPIQSPYALGAFIGGLPPDAPSDLKGTAKSYDTIDLSWTDNSSDELGFFLERREKGDSNYTVIATLDANVTTYSDEPLSGGITYEYRIRAFNECAESDYATASGTSAITTQEGGFSWCFIGTMLQ
ncbi:MAG: fibronectin type III domain-containing protein [Desulfobacteraceae bacterium]|nr:fibronectin type III domain-containing protein [Desulfobacteraceae bacterium]